MMALDNTVYHPLYSQTLKHLETTGMLTSAQVGTLINVCKLASQAIILSQAILPTITIGKEKLLQLVGCLSNIMTYYSQKTGKETTSKKSSKFWANVKAKITISRKPVIVSKPAFYFKAVSNALSNKQDDPILRIIKALRNISYCGYYCLDSIYLKCEPYIVSLQRILTALATAQLMLVDTKYTEPTKQKQITTNAYKYYIYGLALTMLGNLRKLNAAHKNKDEALSTQHSILDHNLPKANQT